MIAMTTSSSINVKPNGRQDNRGDCGRGVGEAFIGSYLASGKKDGTDEVIEGRAPPSKKAAGDDPAAMMRSKRPVVNKNLKFF
jgi:hypothetical protein